MKRPVTTEEATRVQLRTAREGSAHRRWPPDIVKTFAAAEVIRERAEPARAFDGLPLPATLRSLLARARHTFSPGSARAGA